MKRTAPAFFCELTALVLSWTGAAAAYPDRPIHLVVPLAAGGGTDTAARLVANALGDTLKQQVVVENRPGGATIAGTQAVAKAEADGYTLLIASPTLTINPSLKKNLPYDTLTAFAPIGQISIEPYVVLVNPSAGLATIQDLIAAAKANPGKLNFGSPGVGSGGHLAGELFKIKAGVDMLHVPYKGSAPALTDLLGGRIQVIFATVLAAAPYLQAHSLEALAVTGSTRSKSLPEIPTMAESGVPGYLAASWNGLVAPAGTPKAVMEKLEQALRISMKDPAVLRILAQSGAEPTDSTREEFANFLRAEIAKWHEVIEKSDIKPE